MAPSVDLGRRFSIASFAPGRFANAIRKTTRATHARQRVREDMASSFILELLPGGGATVCRGWSYQSSNDGPKVHTAESLREQLGYRGRWQERDGWVHLDLRLDDTVCPRVAQYSGLVPDHAPEWHLRCLPVVSRTGSPAGPLFACGGLDPEPRFGEDGPHALSGILPGSWIVLGAGNGLRISSEGTSVDARGAPPTIRVELSSDRIETGAWDAPL